jgi:hypothetical protein
MHAINTHQDAVEREMLTGCSRKDAERRVKYRDMMRCLQAVDNSGFTDVERQLFTVYFELVYGMAYTEAYRRHMCGDSIIGG